MDKHHQFAYRYLLYTLALDARRLSWPPRVWQWVNPWFWPRYIRQVREVGEVAEWLHNLALFSGLDFADFDEARFWRKNENHRKWYSGFVYYRGQFENALAMSRTGRWPSIEEQQIRNANY